MLRLELRPMRQAAILVLLCVVSAGQASAPIPDSKVPQRKQILQNRRATISLLELAPQEATPIHKHDHDVLAVFVSGDRTENTILGYTQPADKMTAGEAHFINAGYTQTGGRVLADRSLSRLLGSDWPRTLDELEALKRW